MITEKMIRESKDTVWIFGDNLEHVGNAGQAEVCRKFVKEGKTFGIPTKRKPTNDESAYFTGRDDEIKAVESAFKWIRKLSKTKKILFFPKIGEGLADLPNKCPKIYHLILQNIIQLKNENRAETWMDEEEKKFLEEEMKGWNLMNKQIEDGDF